jgi:hypothetical protein
VINNINLELITSTLSQTNNTEQILLFVLIVLSIWSIFSLLIVQFLPRRYKQHKIEIFLFFTLFNVALLFTGAILTVIMLLFGLAWATHRVSRPTYETIYFQEKLSDFPMVESKFHEGILALETNNSQNISSDEKIKSLKILFDSHAQNNIGQIQKFLSDSSDETRLYAFALISTFEKELNSNLKSVQEKLNKTEDAKRVEQYRFELAQTYWQFIFHGVANEQLTSFYTEKIEEVLKEVANNKNAFVLLGKIKIFNKEYDKAEQHFLKAIELGTPPNALATFFAEIKYGQQKFNEVSQYILEDEFNIDLRLKPLISVWRAS